MMFMRFWILCCATLIVALGLVWLVYRMKSVELGLKGWGSELGTILCVSAAQALLLFLVWKVLGWTHWMQYLVAGAIAAIGYKASHVEEMESVEPLIIALCQAILFLPALKFVEPFWGKILGRILPHL